MKGLHLLAGIFCLTVGLWNYDATFIDALSIALALANFVIVLDMDK